MDDTRNRILDVGRDLLGTNPDAGMADIAAAAGVVRRTVYGHFPARSDLIRTLAERAAEEITDAVQDVDTADVPADAAWAEFVARVWPLAHRYRVLLALRRGEQGDEIHALLASVDRTLADLVRRGQEEGAFGQHLPALVLGQLAYSAVFTIADIHRADGTLDVRAATITSLLTLGVPGSRAISLAERSTAH
ncbi:TetR/AcrR family transcriptional regulator [Leifsonia sp. SIMBA_070]|uniref:TetR/AcrR family transcriptional regulator n=1 Tax=Leifsonia sp. SIMBA_070 TaxID=3085810 RepID=UPI00397E61EF